ncbi:MAG: ABC transporter substrate-binding protein [Mariprofundus sp.]|nr:ABC transporter substrate-binding protein [Mariprofundus sp.]
MNRIQLSLVMILGMFFSMPAWAEADHETDQAGPRSVIESTITKMLDILEQREDKSAISTQDRAAIRQTIAGKFDYRSMAKRSLGRPWKKLDETDREHFTSVFRDLLERSYGNRLSAYKGQKVIFAKAEIKQNKARVKSTIIDGSRETPVEYRLHQSKNGWQVYDIRIEGTSMVRTFYQDFKSTLDNGGYPKLVKVLEEKVAKLIAKDQG